MTTDQLLPCGCEPDHSPVFWNEYNGAVQCHKCGAVYSIISIYPTPSIPTHDGNSVAGVSAEWDLAESVLGKCTCNVAYVSRQMADPNCAWCEYHVDMIESIRSVCADKDREILHLTDQLKSAQAEVERLKWEKELMLRSNTRWTEKAKQLESELAESNRRVAEIEDTWIGKDNGLPKPK